VPVEALFILGNVVVLPFWTLMILLPGWDWTQRIIASPFIIIPPALCYLLVLLGLLFGSSPIPFSFDLYGVAALLATPAGAASAWLHLLTFDLFVGRWVYLESRQQGANIPITSLILVCVFLAGPLGFLLYIISRRVVPSQHLKVSHDDLHSRN
jgi:hypothetical protein